MANKKYNKRYLEKIDNKWEIRGDKKGPAHFVLDTKQEAIDILVKLNDYGAVDEVVKGKFKTFNISKYKKASEKGKFKNIDKKKRKFDSKVDKSEKEAKKLNSKAKKLIANKTKEKNKFTKDQLEQKRIINRKIKANLNKKIAEASYVEDSYKKKLRELKSEQSKLQEQLKLKKEKQDEIKKIKESKSLSKSEIKAKVSSDIKRYKKESKTQNIISRKNISQKLNANGTLATIQHTDIDMHARVSYSIRSFGKFPATLLSVLLVFVSIAVLYIIALLVI